MHFISWLSKEVCCGFLITWCSIFSSFGQTTPAQSVIDSTSTPSIFAPGVVSSPYSEWATSFTPDGNTVYFCRGTIYWTICFSTKVNGAWTRPQLANISGQWNDTDPVISADGKRMIFVSNRPLPGTPQDKPQKNFHLWYAERTGDNQWGAPVHIKAPVNIEGANNYGPSISSNGTLCFCSRNREGYKGMASYSAKWVGDHYEKPKLLALNGTEDTQDPFIAPDESYIVFASGNDLYISYRQGDGWTAGQKLAAAVNNGDSISSPAVSPDGKTLYYSSARLEGLIKRDPKRVVHTYDELERELSSSIYNSEGNILCIPINIPKS
jgi:Tol biopolymer transport system component